MNEFPPYLGMPPVRIGRLSELSYGVAAWRHQRALAGDREAIAALEEAVTHYDVVMKALSEGKQVPFDVVAEYPSLLDPEPDQSRTIAAAAPEQSPVAAFMLPSIKSARKRTGPARVVKAHEVAKFGRRGMVSEYLVVFQDGRFPAALRRSTESRRSTSPKLSVVVSIPQSSR